LTGRGPLEPIVPNRKRRGIFSCHARRDNDRPGWTRGRDTSHGGSLPRLHVRALIIGCGCIRSMLRLLEDVQPCRGNHSRGMRLGGIPPVSGAPVSHVVVRDWIVNPDLIRRQDTVATQRRSASLSTATAPDSYPLDAQASLSYRQKKVFSRKNPEAVMILEGHPGHVRPTRGTRATSPFSRGCQSLGAGYTS